VPAAFSRFTIEYTHAGRFLLQRVNARSLSQDVARRRSVLAQNVGAAAPAKRKGPSTRATRAKALSLSAALALGRATSALLAAPVTGAEEHALPPGRLALVHLVGRRLLGGLLGLLGVGGCLQRPQERLHTGASRVEVHFLNETGCFALVECLRETHGRLRSLRRVERLGGRIGHGAALRQVLGERRLHRRVDARAVQHVVERDWLRRWAADVAEDVGDGVGREGGAGRCGRP